MKTPLFIPQDFTLKDDGAIDERSIRHAEFVNGVIDTLIAEAPVVYSYNGQDDWFTPTAQDYPNVKYKARLMFIEEIKPKCEKHEPMLQINVVNNILTYSNSSICRHCGIELVVDWRTKC